MNSVTKVGAAIVNTISSLRVSLCKYYFRMQHHSFQVNRLVSIILKEDRKGEGKYKYFKDKDELSWRTPLHLVAELNYATVARTILCHYPGQLYITTNPHAGNKNHRHIPLELALLSFNDEVSALLIEHMKSERYVFLSPSCRCARQR